MNINNYCSYKGSFRRVLTRFKNRRIDFETWFTAWEIRTPESFEAFGRWSQFKLNRSKKKWSVMMIVKTDSCALFIWWILYQICQLNHRYYRRDSKLALEEMYGDQSNNFSNLLWYMVNSDITELFSLYNCLKVLSTFVSSRENDKNECLIDGWSGTQSCQPLRE